MIAVVADTHGSERHRLAGTALEAVRSADLVIHAGDFTTSTVLAAFEAEATSLAGVWGNNDDAEVRDRLPAERVVAHDGVRIALAHGHDHSETALPLFAREAAADLVVVGHSHRPGFGRIGGVPVLDPGSHAEPRWSRPGFATLRVGDRGIAGRVMEPDGSPIEEFHVERSREKTDR